MRPTSPATALALGVLGVALGVLAGEVALRAAGFEFRAFAVQFAQPPRKIEIHYQEDPDLFWVTRDYSLRLAQARRMERPVVFMGDSCTDWGSYPEEALRILDERRPGSPRGMKFAVSGWSTEQGLRQLRRDLLPLHPSVVSVYFGWNDHWTALGPPDKDIHVPHALFWLSQHSRVAQLVAKARFAWLLPPVASRVNRVALPEYRSNLETIVSLCRQGGAQAVLITAPSGHVRGREPKSLLERRLRRLEDLVPTHQAYVEATREAARGSGAVLCDAAGAFLDRADRAEEDFMKDGVHLKESGNQFLAGLVAGCISSALDSLRPER